jgi:chemotaxis protein methyltransferase WspC
MTIGNVEALLRDAIGLDPASIGSQAVVRAVQDRQAACALPDTEAYWKRAWTSEAERQELIEAVVVAETWFFRDRAAFVALGHMATAWLAANASGVFRVLSLPCSTGEEPYSIAMALLDGGMPPHRFVVDAVDVSTRALDRAQRAIYGRNSFRGNDLAFRVAHCTPTPDGYQVADRVRRQVAFSRGNMFTSDAVPGALGRYDVVFCRNLLIYFDRDTQHRALNVVEHLLTPTGAVFVAPSETALLLERRFSPLDTPQAFGFRRCDRSVAEASRPIPFKTAAKRTPTPPTPIRPSVPPANAPPQVAASCVRGAETTTLDEAAHLANIGRFPEAVAACERHVREQGPSAAAFHLLGIVQDAAGDPHAAASCFRKALYLDPDLPEVMMHLALLMERFDRPADAQVLRNRARRAAMRIGA